MDLKSVLREVVTWPVEERLRLIEEVWDTLPATPDSFTLSDAQRQDLRRRLDAHRADPKAGSTWEDVEARLRGDRR